MPDLIDIRIPSLLNRVRSSPYLKWFVFLLYPISLIAFTLASRTMLSTSLATAYASSTSLTLCRISCSSLFCSSNSWRRRSILATRRAALSQNQKSVSPCLAKDSMSRGGSCHQIRTYTFARWDWFNSISSLHASFVAASRFFSII